MNAEKSRFEKLKYLVKRSATAARCGPLQTVARIGDDVSRLSKRCSSTSGVLFML